MIANYPEIFLAEYLATQLPRLAAEFLFLNSMRIPQKFSNQGYVTCEGRYPTRKTSGSLLIRPYSSGPSYIY